MNKDTYIVIGYSSKVDPKCLIVYKTIYDNNLHYIDGICKENEFNSNLYDIVFKEINTNIKFIKNLSTSSL